MGISQRAFQIRIPDIFGGARKSRASKSLRNGNGRTEERFVFAPTERVGKLYRLLARRRRRVTRFFVSE